MSDWDVMPAFNNLDTGTQMEHGCRIFNREFVLVITAKCVRVRISKTCVVLFSRPYLYVDDISMSAFDFI